VDTRLAHSTSIGIPLRPHLTGLDRAALRGEARQLFGLRADGPVLLVTGGSPGAPVDAAGGFYED
jgi:UDP-N-acetylglucosamine--N-acetylmuramyl-(pentapeptide) pyrophosphoryl-undecaprenol N-acetylglucosamine transferase